MMSIILSGLLTATPASDVCVPLEAVDLEATCQAHPWQKAPTCDVVASLDECVGLLKQLSGCSLTECEYVQCVDALAVAGCFERPAACEEVAKCLNG